MINDCLNKIDEISAYLNQHVERDIHQKFITSMNLWLSTQLAYISAISRNTDLPNLTEERTKYMQTADSIVFKTNKQKTKFYKLLSEFEKLTLSMLLARGLK